MSVGVLRSSATKPDLADLLARARAIAELARERAQQTEATRRVGDDMIEHMRQADLFRVMQPRVYGGVEEGLAGFGPNASPLSRGWGAAPLGFSPPPPPPHPLSPLLQTGPREGRATPKTPFPPP